MSDALKKISCPLCKKVVPTRGIFGHLRLAHGKATEEAHELMASQRESTDGKITRLPLSEDELKEDNINKIFGLFDKVVIVSGRIQELGEGKGFYASLSEETIGELADCLQDVLNNALGEIENLGIGFKATDTNMEEILDVKRDRIKKVFGLIEELKNIRKWKEDIEAGETVYNLTDEEAEDLKDGLEELDENVCESLENLNIYFERDEEDEEEEEDEIPEKKKKSWFARLFSEDEEEEGEEEEDEKSAE